jgi:WD40 repeat protein
MALTPLGVSLSSKYELTGPDGTVATFNDPTDANFVGYLTEITGLDSPEVRDNGENLAGQDGGVHGPFYYGRRPITMTGALVNLTSTTDREEKITKLRQASNAMRSNATLKWTPPGGEAVYVEVRRQQPLRVSGDWNKTYQLMIVSADARIYAVATTTGTANFAESEVLPGGKEPYGSVASPDGKFIYVANKGANTCSVYSRNTSTGALAKVEDKATGTKPHSVIVSPDGKHVYVTNNEANTISKFSRNESTGVLTTVSAATATGTGPNKPDITKDGKYIYVPNRAGNTISVFERNSSTGELTLKETSALLPATQGPSVCSVGEATTNSNASVLVGCYTSGKVFSYVRSKTTGALSIQGSAYTFVPKETFEGTNVEKIVDIDKFEAEEPGAGADPSKKIIHFYFVLGENGIGGKVRTTSEEAGGADVGKSTIVEQEFAGFKVANTATKPLFVVSSPLEYEALYLTENTVGKVRAGFHTTWNEYKVGASSSNMGRPVRVGEHLYVPAADKVFEYTVKEVGGLVAPALVQKFHNKTGGVSVTNKGSAEVFPTLTVTTTVGQEVINPVFTNQTTEEAVVLSIAIKENSVLLLNMNKRTVTLNGINVFAAVNLSQTAWWAVQPGVNELLVSQELAVGSPKAVATFHSAWV